MTFRALNGVLSSMRDGRVIGIVILFCVSLLQVPVYLDWSETEENILPPDIDFDNELLKIILSMKIL